MRLTNRAKRISIVGSGPAGIEAAIASSSAGHKVTLYEKNSRLGGRFARVSAVPSTGEQIAFLAWAINELHDLDVQIKLNTRYTAEICEREKPDLVIIATGARYDKLNFLENANICVITAEEALEGKSQDYSRIIVIGCDTLGCETALYLASQRKQVTLIDDQQYVASELESNRRETLMAMLEKLKVDIFTPVEILNISKKGIIVSDKKHESMLDADCVVIAKGLIPNDELSGLLTGKTELITIGDAKEVRQLMESIRDGFLAGTA
jgi:2-enoate reductase